MYLICGHSQGAQVTHNALQLVGGDVKSHVAAVVCYTTCKRDWKRRESNQDDRSFSVTQTKESQSLESATIKSTPTAHPVTQFVWGCQSHWEHICSMAQIQQRCKK